MSSGPIGSGISYFATIKIDGPLTQTELAAIVTAIKAQLAALGPPPVNGQVTAEVRLPTGTPPVTTIQIT